MAASFQIEDNVTKTSADVTGNHIYISPEQNNSQDFDSIKLVVDYHDLQSTDGSTKIQAVIENKSAEGTWYPVAYQFDEFNSVGEEFKQLIIMEPNMFWADAGIPDVMFVGGKTIAHRNPQTGKMTDKYRLCITLRDPNSAFTSLRFSAYGDLFNAI